MGYFRMDSKLAEISGIHAGDGYLRNDGKRRELDISGNIEEKDYYNNHIIPLFNKIFNLNIKGKFFPSRNTYGFVIRDLDIVEFFHEKLGFPYGKKSLIVKPPTFVFKNVEFMKFFARGYFDTDGCLSFSKRNGNYCKFKKTRHYYPFISFGTVSDNMSEKFKLILTKLDFNFGYSTYKPKVTTQNLSHYIILNGVENMERWLRLVGTKNPVKYSRYLVWKRYGFCPIHTTYAQRLKMISGSLDPDLFYIRGP